MSNQRGVNNIPAASHANNTRRPKLPCRDLIDGSREDYLKIGVPLYEASINCDWKAAKAIFDEYPGIGYERYSITENGETALHIAASAKGNPNKVSKFVKNLVEKMNNELDFDNENYNTALYLAAVAGNIETVKIMMEWNGSLLAIPGGGSKTKLPNVMPLYAAALFGNHEVVKYMYEKSNNLNGNEWTLQTRGWLLQKCVENDMFDIALKIASEPQNLSPESKLTLLGVLARKPDAFAGKKRWFLTRFFIWVCASCLMEKAHEKERRALKLLNIIWTEIAKKPKGEIDRIIRGKADPIKQDNKASVRVSQAIQLESIISKHVSEMRLETEKIMRGQPAELTTKEKVDQALRLEQHISKFLVKFQVETHNIIKESPIPAKEDLVMELQKLISQHIVKMHVGTHNIIRGKSAFPKETQAPPLQVLISECITALDVATKDIVTKAPVATIPRDTYSSRLLFVAAELGNTRFLVELIRQYPDLIWKVNDDNQTIFHIAVKHRHEGVYNLLYEIGAMKDLITPLRDPNDNNMLHLVGKIAKKKQLEDVSGVALQMQRELLWFQEVKNMIPPSYRERGNKDGLTPHELFTKEHKDLLKEGEKWMKGTASQCMVVAALIATIVFAAAFTVPGGYMQHNGHQDNGIPVFHSKATFMVFVVADAISLFMSSASILMFLSILTSRYAERDFLSSLPLKLMFGLLFLFLSITTMTVAFSVSFFVLYRKDFIWMPILIGAFALFPVLLYLFLQFSLFFDVIRSTVRSRYLFKPGKHVLYYENPKV